MKLQLDLYSIIRPFEMSVLDCARKKVWCAGVEPLFTNFVRMAALSVMHFWRNLAKLELNSVEFLKEIFFLMNSIPRKKLEREEMYIIFVSVIACCDGID